MGWLGNPRQNLQAMVEAHYAELYRYAYRLSGSSQEAEDLTQETFCLAQNKLHQLRDGAKAKSWLFTILRNAYLHRLRAAKMAKQVSLNGVGELMDRNVEALPEFDAAHLQIALNELPEVFRTPIILFYFEEFSYRDIAEQMDVPLGTVMSRLARGKAFLRQRLLGAVEGVGKTNQEEEA